MRVTQIGLARLLSAELNEAYERASIAIQRMGTGKRIRRLSDDAVSAVMAMRCNMHASDARLNEAVAQRLSDTLQAYDNMLSEVGETLQRLRELVLQASSTALDDLSRSAIAMQIDSLKQHLFQLANSKYGDAYLFGGTKSNSAPFVILNGNVTYVGGRAKAVWLGGERLSIGVAGDEAFINGVNLFEVFEDCASGVRSGNVGWLSGEGLRAVDSALDKVVQLRALVGAQSERVEGMQFRAMWQCSNYEAMASNYNGADIAFEAMELSLAQTKLYAITSLIPRFFNGGIIDALV